MGRFETIGTLPRRSTIIAGYAWLATALLAYDPTTHYFGIVTFLIAAGALILWNALAWAVVGAEIRSTAGPA